MEQPSATGPRSLPPAPWGALPPRLSVLHVMPADAASGWLREALAIDSACQVSLDVAPGTAAGLAQVRDEAYDAVLVEHVPGTLDAWEFVAALRGGGSAEPVVVLGRAPAGELAADCCEAGADDYLDLRQATTRSLIWVLARAVERQRLIREHRRLAQSERQRLEREERETARLLAEQRSLVRELENLARATTGSAADDARLATASLAELANHDLPPESDYAAAPELVAHYRELLRVYVMMGSGNLARERTALVDLLVTTGTSAPEALVMHLAAVEELVRGLGGRSARHVLNRADLLALELVMHLAEGYRRASATGDRRGAAA